MATLAVAPVALPRGKAAQLRRQTGAETSARSEPQATTTTPVAERLQSRRNEDAENAAKVKPLTSGAMSATSSISFAASSSLLSPSASPSSTSSSPTSSTSSSTSYSSSASSLQPSSSTTGDDGLAATRARRPSATQELLLTRCFFYRRDTTTTTPQQPPPPQVGKVAGASRDTSRLAPDDAGDKHDDACRFDYDNGDDDGDENPQTSAGCISSPNDKKPDKGLEEKLLSSHARYKRLGQCCARCRSRSRQQASAGVVAGANGCLLLLEGSVQASAAGASLAPPAERVAQTRQAKGLQLQPAASTERSADLRLRRQPSQVGGAICRATCRSWHRQSDNLSLGSDTCGCGGGGGAAGAESLSPTDSVAPNSIGGALEAGEQQQQQPELRQRPALAPQASISSKGLTRISSATTNSFESPAPDDAVPQLAPSAPEHPSSSILSSSGSSHLRSSSRARRRSPSPLQQQQPTRVSKPQLSIEEQIKRLLEIGPTKEELERQERESEAARANDMKKSAMFGGGGGRGDQQRDAYHQQQAHQSQPQSRYQSAPSNGMSANDRMMIFMLASRSTQTNSTVERNARILKWLNNCKDASAR